MKEKMNKDIFIHVLNAYGIGSDQVYEDISELGKVLWHNDKLSLKVVSSQQKQPCLVIVVLRTIGEYLYFECSLDEFDISTIAQVIEYVQANDELLYETTTKANDVLDITIGNRNWQFRVGPT